MLLEQLSLPQKLISLPDKLLRVSNMRIKLPLDWTAPSNALRLYELETGGADARAVMLVRYPRAEFRIPPTERYF
jgi:hypothetical protein